MQSIDAPLVVVTTQAHGQMAGCVIGFHTQCSIEPVRYAVWLSKANFTYRVALFATHMALHFLNDGDHDGARLFGGTSGDRTDKFAECEWRPGPFDVPLLVGCPNRMVLQRVTAWDDGSDHVCFVGQPVDASSDGRFTPLRLSAAADIEPGHPAQDRPAPAAIEASDRTARAERPTP